NEGSVDDLLRVVKAAPPRSLVLYIRYSEDDPGNIMYPSEVAAAVVKASPVPVYVTINSYIGSGAVGGVVRNLHAQGTRVGQMVRQILDGARPKDIPFEVAGIEPMVDWRQVKRWKIDESRLPPGTNIQFRVPTPWESYRWYIIAIVAVVGAQTLLIAALLTQRARRRRAELVIQANRRACERATSAFRISRDISSARRRRHARASRAIFTTTWARSWQASR